MMLEIAADVLGMGALLLSYVAGFMAIALILPIGVLFIECVAALFPTRSQPVSNSADPRIAVLMPAHNEASGIAPVLQNLMPQLKPQDRLVVIADNCTDETAAIARDLGATVLERSNSRQRGKGYALDYGIQALAENPPDVVVLMDADCFAEAEAIAKIARLSAATQRPTQAIYLMEQPAKTSPTSAISALAFLVKNWARPQGMDRLGVPCLLTGTGMAFPWKVIYQASLASGNLVEDMQMGLDMAIAGYSPQLCADAHVTGRLPSQNTAATSQRTRWEHGHLQTLITQVPRLLKAALRQGRLDLLAIALDLSIPPLSLLVMLWLAAMALATFTFLLGGSPTSSAFLAIQGGMLFGAIVCAWGKYGRSMIPLKALAAIPLYVLWKVPIYLKFLAQPQTQWVRTERD